MERLLVMQGGRFGVLTLDDSVAAGVSPDAADTEFVLRPHGQEMR